MLKKSYVALALGFGVLLAVPQLASAQLAANLVVTKTANVSSVQNGGLITWTVVVHNEGPGDANNVSLTDTLPITQISFQGGNFSQGTCARNNGTISCDLGFLAAGASANITATGRVTVASGSLVNSAMASADELDLMPNNNRASVTTPIGTTMAGPDLQVTKSAAPNPVTVNGDLAYTITVVNVGTASASNVSVSDPVLNSLNASNPQPSQGTCTKAVMCSLGTMAAGVSALITFTVRPQNAGTLTNTVTVSTTSPETNMANNMATVDTTVVPRNNMGANLSVTKTGPATLAPGATGTYMLVVANAGPATATGLNLTDVLPTGLTFVSAAATPGTCTHNAGTVNCTLTSLASGSTWTATVMAKAGDRGVVMNTATVTANETDPTPSNNTSTVTTNIGGVVLPDGGVTPDGSMPGVDSGPKPDGAASTFDIEGAGCKCMAVQHGRAPLGGVLLLGVLGLALLVRRRGRGDA